MTTRTALLQLIGSLALCAGIVAVGAPAWAAPIVDQPFASVGAAAAPMEVVTDAAGNVYVANVGTHTISVTTPDGSVTRTFADLTMAFTPHLLTIDGSGNLYAADVTAKKIARVSAGGLVDLGYLSLGAGASVYDLRADGAGDVYVVDGVNDVVTRIENGSKVLSTYSVGKAPTSVEISPDGTVFVAVRGAKAIASISPSGTVDKTALSLTTFPDKLAFDASGDLYILNSDLTIAKVTPALAVDATYAKLPAGSAPIAMVADAVGDLFVNDSTTSSVIRIDTMGTARSGFVNFGTGDNLFGSTVSASSRLLVTDYNTGTITQVRLAAEITSPIPPATGTIGSVYRQPVTGAGLDTVTFEFSGTLPPDVTLSPTTGLLEGTPTRAGTFEFDLYAVNAFGRSAPQHATVVIPAVTTPASPAPTTAPAVQAGRSTMANAATGAAPAAELARTGVDITPGVVIGGLASCGTGLALLALRRRIRVAR